MLKTGNPFSFFLFTIAIDILSKIFIRVEDRGFLVGKYKKRVSLLQFAYDIFFSQVLTMRSYKTLSRSLWLLVAYQA